MTEKNNTKVMMFNNLDYNSEYADYVYCPHCGKYELIPIGATYCPNCGNEVVWAFEDKDIYEVNINEFKSNGVIELIEANNIKIFEEDE